MRTKRRYLAFEIIGRIQLRKEGIQALMLRSHMRYAGEKSFNLSSPWLISYDEKNQRGIVRSDLAGVDDLRASMVLTEEVDGERLILRTLGVSGTLRACEDRFIRKSGPKVIEEADKRNGEEDPGMRNQVGRLRALAPGSKVTFSHKELKLKQAYDDGRVDLKSDEGSFGFTILDLLGSSLASEV